MNEVLYWNAVLLEASRRDNTAGYANNQQPGPTNTSRAMALVHLAIHDTIAYAVNPAAAYMAKKKLAVAIPWPVGAAVGDAIAGAAVTTLKRLYPGYEAYFDDALGNVNPLGFNLGVAVATNLLALRAADGSALPATVPQPAAANLAYSEHRADPYTPSQPLLSTTWGSVTHFVGPRVPLANHPGRGASNLLTNPHYKADYDEVRSHGAQSRGSRTAEQTLIGVYWGYDGAQGIGVPPRMYNQIVRRLIADHDNATGATPLTVAQTADLFAQVNVAMADGGIDAWFHKYDQNLWRPVVGIREEGMPDGDCFWAPLGAPQTNQTNARPRTPPFPAYPSGHATFGAALFQVLRLQLVKGAPLTIEEVLAADVATQPQVPGEAFGFVSDELDGRAVDPDGSLRTRIERGFGSYARAVWENAVSRVYLGVHWRFDGLPASAGQNIGGVPLGLKIGEQVHTLFAGTNSLANH